MNFDKSNSKNWFLKHKILTVIFGIIALILIFAIIGKITGFTSSPDWVNYEIISEKEDMTWSDMSKCKIKVQLEAKASEKRLTEIANELRETRTSYKQLYIWYYLPDTDTSSTAWGTTHFLPDLKVEIVGSTVEEEAKQLAVDIPKTATLIGRFHEEQSTASTYTIYKNEGKTFVKMTFKNGQSLDDEMTESEVDTGIKLEYKSGGSRGEYFILTKDDVLEFYNSENKMFTSATKIN